MNINEFIKFQRKKKKLTLVQLAGQAGISYGMLYRLEEGSIKKPHPDLLKKIANSLALNYEDVLKKAGVIRAVKQSQKKKKQSKTLPLESLETLFEVKKTIITDTISVQTKGPVDNVVQCPDNAFLPFIKQGDRVALRKQDVLQDGTFNFIEDIDGSLELILTKKDNVTDDINQLKFPNLWVTNTLEKSKKGGYEIVAIISNSHHEN